MANRIHPLEISPRLVLHVGMVAIQWARIEFTLSKLMVGLLRAEAPVGLLLTSGMAFQTIKNFVACYVEANPLDGPIFCEELTTLIEEADRLRIVRNSLVHNSWHPDEVDQHHLLVLRFRGRIKIHSEVWSDEQFTAIIQDMIDLLGGMAAFLEKYNLQKAFLEWEQLSSSPEAIAPRRLAEIRERSPRTVEILRQLRS
jgi:hypothetical protein